MGERMSAAMISQIYAVAETPGMPYDFEATQADEGQGSVPAPTDYEPPVLDEIDPTQTNLAEPEAIDHDAALESPTHEDEADIPEDVVAPGLDPDLRLYRKRTVRLLRRYMRLSIEVGRLPSLLGREFFRTRVTSYRASTFEDAVIFVHDVERSLDKLSEFDKKLIAKIVLQEYSQEEAARLIGCGRRHAVRCYPEALDRLSEMFLKRELLTRLPNTKPEAEKSCQGGNEVDFHVSDSEQAENKC
jgi:DNA-directed RNA polymerase specialized sigma24 family protein